MRPDDDNQRKKKKPLDKSKKQNEYNKVFQMMEQLMQKAFLDLTDDSLRPGFYYTYGFNIHINKDGIPHIEQVGDYPSKSSFKPMRFSDVNERDSVYDFIEYYDSVSVTTELFGIKRDDIQISIHNQQLIIAVDDDNSKYQETVHLPVKVNADSIHYTYNNGILDISIKKKYLCK